MPMDNRATVGALLAAASARANELPGIDGVEFKFLQNSQREFVGSEDILSDVVSPDEACVYALTPLAVGLTTTLAVPLAVGLTTLAVGSNREAS